jgi:signal transduction histidine kinase
VREWLAGKLASPDRIEALRRTAANFHEQVLQEPAVTSRILDGLSEGIAVSVAESGADDPRLVAANAGFALLVGIEPASARGKPLLDLLLDAGVRREEANKLLEAGGEVVIWSRRLGPRTVRSRRRNLLTVTCPSKERSLFMLEFLDTTASDQINRALEVARERAENAEAARNAFLANLSHELRTPLIGITGYADLILSETDGPLGSALYREQLEQIRESGDHLLTTVSSLLHYVELKGGNYRRSSIRVDLRKPLQIELARLGSKVARRRILLETRFPDSPLELDVDEGLMRLLATHLLENSVKFTKPGGKILFELASANGNAWIDVRDNGIGIPDALVPRVFSPFFQAEMSVSRGNEGTGLGLPLVKAIAEVHGGSVMLNSQESLGTHVRVLLPMPASSPMP